MISGFSSVSKHGPERIIILIHAKLDSLVNPGNESINYKSGISSRFLHC